MDSRTTKLAVYVTTKDCLRYGAGLRVLMVPGAKQEHFPTGRLQCTVTALEARPSVGVAPGMSVEVDYMHMEEVSGYAEALSLLERVSASEMPAGSAARAALGTAREALRSLCGQ